MIVADAVVGLTDDVSPLALIDPSIVLRVVGFVRGTVLVQRRGRDSRTCRPEHRVTGMLVAFVASIPVAAVVGSSC